MNYYPFHIGDYASTTRHLSWDEDLAYRRLIDAYYAREEAIPADKRAVYRLVCATTDAQREAVDVVLQEFFVLSGDVWVQSRCEAEIHVAKTKREKAAQSAKLRWEQAKALQEQMQAQSERNANASETLCERIENACEGNAPNPNPNPNISTDVDIKKTRASRFDARAHLLSIGVPEQIARDWLTHRKAKRAAPTQTAIERISKEAAKARITLADALSISCQRGWVGFEAAWISKVLSPALSNDRRQTAAETRANTIAELTGRKFHEQPQERDITADCQRLC